MPELPTGWGQRAGSMRCPAGHASFAQFSLKSSLIIKIHFGKSLRLSRQGQNPPRVHGNGESGGSKHPCCSVEVRLLGMAQDKCPFLSPGCSQCSAGGTQQGPGSSSRDMELGLCPPLLGKQGLPGTGRWGSRVLSSGLPKHATSHCRQLPRCPVPPSAAWLPRVLPAARHTSARRPAAAARREPAVPPPFPAITRAPNGVLLHPVLQRRRGWAHRGDPAGRVPPAPAGSG